ncbi:isocitrate lyase/PEP mutase family protein [Pseudomonadales bacterium]|nr:isocitrate lyase/PEP mutase family protein [Pseudomonadales bacterium]MDB9880397.1 isocitrate lyase/PEP mutase family protein [Pseudomonadales bacterium]MDB9942358.1 isocitrate lyase/PEP mutase family protein [Pseudomonadales bacterium]MDC0174415.1 isocitrate lyase/PEP mutase family protein [Pseudomonadales bacterium]MDC1306788.1 isocitrate lyase/PEP mutase family protein [Pseudomonadales bacterium]
MLKQLMNDTDYLVLPGVYDGLSALIASQAGFKALYMTGFGVAASLLGKPDIGLVTATEMVERAAQIVAAAGAVPVIADGDNGYGGELNVMRLVQAYERAGVAAIQLEDQVMPKRCGHMEGKLVVSMDEAVQKIRAAIAARSSPDFLVIARTDARATHDLDEALRRGHAMLDAGADILFIEAPQSEAEMQIIASTFAGVPLVANMVEDGKTPEVAPAVLAAMGFRLILRPVAALLRHARVLQLAYGELAATGALASDQPRLAFADFNELVGLAALQAQARQFNAS